MKHWPGIAVVTALIGLAVGFMMLRPAAGTQPVYIDVSADLSFIFECKRRANPPSEESIQNFMSYNGFRVLDRSQQMGRRRLKLDMIGIDSAHRKLEFGTDPTGSGSYFAALYSEPPTQHATVLEDSLLAFTEMSLRCKTSQVERSGNPAEARDSYDFSFSRTEDQFKRPPLK